MTKPTITIPPRKWAADELPPTPEPIVLISSRESYPLPELPNRSVARRNIRELAELGGAHGWKVRERYAKAVLDYVVIETVSVRLYRDDMFAIGLWWNKDAKGWGFETGLYGFSIVGFKALCSAVVNHMPGSEPAP